MTNVVLDNIIFSIQKAGGISVVWQEHVKRLLSDTYFRAKFLEYENALNNVFRKELSIASCDIIQKKSVLLKFWKYLDLNNKEQKSPYIFHSSVYRIDRNKRAQNVVTVHDFAYERYVNGFPKWINGIAKFRAIRKADAVICISESTKRDLLNLVSGVDETKIYVVYNGVGEDYYVLSESEYELPIPFPNKQYILYVGNRHDYKNFAAALYCCKKLRFPLVIAGGETFSNEEIKELNVNVGIGNYYITGKISNKHLNELYNRAGVLLYPSKFEGFGIPILESQRAGCPVVCLSLSSIPEVMGECAFCLKEKSYEAITNAVKTLFEDSSAREAEIQRGFINSQRFSWDKTYEETTKVYKQLLCL